MAANYQDHKEYFSPATARGDRDRPSGQALLKVLC